MSDRDYEIVDLRDAPQFFETVADRIWHAWWADDGFTLDNVRDALTAVIGSAHYPFTLVAVHDGHFLGTVTSVMDDINARPNWGPCLAALWVEPDCRGQGVAVGLAKALMDRLATLDFERVYLSAKPKMRAYYLLRGWTMIDSDIDKDHHDVFMREL